jgi:lipopolysaccharide heptosyltransferase II
VLFTTPTISNLRLAYPQASISYLANRRAADFLKFNTDIAEVFIYERDEFVGNFSKYWELFQTLKSQRFDMVLDFSLNSFFGFLGLVCGIKKRVGFDFRKRGRFLTHRLPLGGFEGKHVVEYDLDLLRLLDIPVITKPLKLDVPPEAVQWAAQWLKSHQVDFKKPLIAVVPGGGASWGKAAGNKRWPASQYADLIDKIIENNDAAVILMGDSKEEELCREVIAQANFPVHFAVGETTLPQMAALLMRCRGAVVNDGGPLHMAVAVGIGTVSIFGPVDPLVYGPYPAGNQHTVQKGLPCQPCYRNFRQARCGHIDCLRNLSVEEVYRKVRNIL